MFEVGTKDYSNSVALIKKALSQMETLTGNYNGYVLGEKSSKFGWTFFKLFLKPGLENAIRAEFSDMIGRYRWGSKDEKFTKFMSDYFQSKGCEIKLKKLA